MRKPIWMGAPVYEDVVNDRKKYPTDGQEVTHSTLIFQNKVLYSASTVGRILKYAKGQEISARREAKNLQKPC